MTWDELNEALIKVAWDVNYIAVDEDGRVTVEVSNVDTSEPIPAYTGLNFEVKKLHKPSSKAEEDTDLRSYLRDMAERGDQKAKTLLNEFDIFSEEEYSYTETD